MTDLTTEQRQRIVNAYVVDFGKSIMDGALFGALLSGDHPKSAIYPPGTPQIERRAGTWTVERIAVERPGKMVIDGEYEVVT